MLCEQKELARSTGSGTVLSEENASQNFWLLHLSYSMANRLLPFLILYKSYWLDPEYTPINITDFILNLQKTLTQMKASQSRLQEAHVKAREKSDQVKLRVLNVVDLVLWKIPGLSKSLSSSWEGPFIEAAQICVAQVYTTLHRTALQYSTVHYTTLHYTTLHRETQEQAVLCCYGSGLKCLLSNDQV